MEQVVQSKENDLKWLNSKVAHHEQDSLVDKKVTQNCKLLFELINKKWKGSLINLKVTQAYHHERDLL